MRIDHYSLYAVAISYRLSAISFQFDGSAPVYGAGIRFNLLGAGVRAEYEKIDIDELDNVEMISISVFYQF